MKRILKFIFIFIVLLSFYNNIYCNENDSFSTIVQPFKIYHECFDMHVMLFFNDHPEYESVEAFIIESGDMPIIRAVITRHNQSQIDFINDETAYKLIKKENLNREFFYVPIEYKKSNEDQNIRIILNFKTHQNENIHFDLITADKPDSKYAGLIDPGNHSINTSFPVMFSEINTLAGENSKIKFNDKEYEIPVKVSFPPYFVGLEGYYSESYSLSVLIAADEKIKIIQSPKKLEQDEQWLYQIEDKNISYKIKSVNDNSIIIENKKETIILNKNNNSLGIVKIIVKNKDQNNFTIDFSVPIPLLLSTDVNNKVKGKFKINIGNHNNAVSGTFSSIMNNNSMKIVMNPKKPLWAKKRGITLNIDNDENILLIKRKMN